MNWNGKVRYPAAVNLLALFFERIDTYGCIEKHFPALFHIFNFDYP
jgi:hypothetical protein